MIGFEGLRGSMGMRIPVRKFTGLGVCLLAALPPTGALAHEPEDDPVALDDVVVLGRARNLVGSAISASQGRVGQPEIESRPMLRTGEILELIPGMIVTQHSGSGKGNQMFLRGFNLDHGTDFATWVDGMPVNLRSHAHGQGYTDINFLIPEMVQEMEFRKGPYFADVGDFSSAGSAHFETFSWMPQDVVKLAGGEDGYARALVAGSAALESDNLVYAVEAQHYDGPWDDIDEDLKKYNGMLRYVNRGEAGHWDVTLMGYDAEWNSADQIPERAVRQGLISDLGSLDTDVGGETSRYSLSARGVRSWSLGQTFVSAYVIDYSLDLWSNFTYFLDDPVNGDEFQQSEDRMIYGGSLAHHWDSTLFGKALAHRTGLEFRYDDVDDVGLYQTVARNRINTFREDDVEEASVGWYYRVEVPWTSRLTTLLGVRADWYDFDVDSDNPLNSGTDDDFLVSPKFNLVYNASPSLDLYLSAGGGFHSNDARGTTISVDPRTGEDVDPVDPLVESEGAEVGLRFAPNPRINSSASLWYLKLDSELLYVGDAGTTEPSTESERWGVEFANYIRPTDWLTLDADYTWTDSELNDNPDGDKIPGAIKNVFSSGITATHPSGLSGSLRVRYFGERPLVEDNSVKSDDFTTVNMQLGYTRGRWRTQLDVLNLFDSDDHDIDYYYASRLEGEPAEGVEDIHFHPIEPRTVRLSVSYRFSARDDDYTRLPSTAWNAQ